MTNPTPREIQLVEAALEAAAGRIENGSFLHDKSPAALFAKEAAKAIRSLDRAAIVASVPQPTEQPEDERERFEAWAVQYCAPLVKKHEVLRRSNDGSYFMYSVEWNWDAWQAAKRDALTQSAALSAQEQVEPTDAEIVAAADAHGTDMGDVYEFSEGQVIAMVRALLSANQGK